MLNVEPRRPGPTPTCRRYPSMGELVGKKGPLENPPNFPMFHKFYIDRDLK